SPPARRAIDSEISNLAIAEARNAPAPPAQRAVCRNLHQTKDF
ncbi:hypothetical protein A2U01_0074777, partial [Trifolium medium]|nr:hypothetical protein [Trifolium medium]